MNIKKITFATLAIGAILCASPSLAGSCKKQGSSVSIATIQSKYKNCVNCGTQKNGNKTVYYCYCGDGCKGTPSTSSSSSSPSSSSSSSSGSSSGSCKKQGSSVSIATIQSKYNNCVNCGTQKNGNKTVYYCYCGDGCQGTPARVSAISSSSSSGNSSSTSSGSCKKQGSSVSIEAIASKYNNCVNCGTQKNGNKTVYYCYCGDGCKGTPWIVSLFYSSPSPSSSSSSSSGNSSSTSSGSCKKQGSSVSIEAITSKYKNCSNCGKQSNGNKTVYYCYCGDCQTEIGLKPGVASHQEPTGKSCKIRKSTASISAITSKYKNCSSCGEEVTNKIGKKKTYFCYCCS